MNLLQLVSYFRMGGSFEVFCQQQSLNIDSEAIDIFMEKPLGINKGLTFSELEKSDGKIELTKNGIEYYYLFDFHYFLDAIEESIADEHKEKSDIELSQILLHFAIHDG